MGKLIKPHLVKSGDNFGSLTVIDFSHLDKRWRRHYLCRCECGKEKTIQGTLLRTGNTKSCGCRSKEAARSRILSFGVAAMNQVIAGYKHKAKMNNREFSLTAQQFDRIAKSPCFYCGAVQTNTKKSPHGTGDYSYNGLDRVESKKGYTFNNSVSCCIVCNMAKKDMSQGEFIKWVRRAFEHLSKNAMADQWG